MSLATEFECGLMGVNVMRHLIEEIFADALAGASEKPQQAARPLVRGRLVHADRPVVRSIRNPGEAVEILCRPSRHEYSMRPDQFSPAPALEDSMEWEPERWDGLA